MSKRKEASAGVAHAPPVLVSAAAQTVQTNKRPKRAEVFDGPLHMAAAWLDVIGEKQKYDECLGIPDGSKSTPQIRFAAVHWRQWFSAEQTAKKITTKILDYTRRNVPYDPVLLDLCRISAQMDHIECFYPRERALLDLYVTLGTAPSAAFEQNRRALDLKVDLRNAFQSQNYPFTDHAWPWLDERTNLSPPQCGVVPSYNYVYNAAAKCDWKSAYLALKRLRFYNVTFVMTWGIESLILGADAPQTDDDRLWFCKFMANAFDIFTKEDDPTVITQKLFLEGLLHPDVSDCALQLKTGVQIFYRYYNATNRNELSRSILQSRAFSALVNRLVVKCVPIIRFVFEQRPQPKKTRLGDIAMLVFQYSGLAHQLLLFDPAVGAETRSTIDQFINTLQFQTPIEID